VSVAYISPIVKYELDERHSVLRVAIGKHCRAHINRVFRQLDYPSIYCLCEFLRAVAGFALRGPEHSVSAYRATCDWDCSKADCRTNVTHERRLQLRRGLIPKRYDVPNRACRANEIFRIHEISSGMSIASTHHLRRSGQRYSKTWLWLVQWYTLRASQISFEVTCPRLFQQREGFCVPSIIAQIFRFEGKSKGKLPRWRYAAKSADIAVHDHGHTHEHDGGTVGAA
jgi:hypothetical protein